MRITVFTPTFNRAYILEHLYVSLQRQIFTDFEWLVIDDGSKDNTKELIENWQSNDNPFQIRYYYFDNCGKQRQINRALDLAKGELFFIVDSDDVLTRDALKKIDQWEKSIPENELFCAFAGSDGNMKGEPTNPLFSGEYIDVNFLNRYPESGLFIGYDRPWVFYTKIHRMYKYPEFPGEKFITEAVTWNRMAADGWKIRCFNDVVYLWEHQDDGLTSTIMQTLIDNPNGFGLWKKELIVYLNFSFFRKIKEYYSFFCDLKDTYSLKKIASFIGVSYSLMKIFNVIYNLKHGGKVK